MVTSKKIKRATVWSSIETLVTNSLSIFSILFLARILTPNDYGQVATAQFIAGLLQLVLSFGLSEAIIQKKMLDNDDIQAAWLGSIFLSILCCLFCFFIGLYFYLINSKVLSYILYFEAINSLLVIFSIVPTAMLMRELEMKAFAHRAIVSRVVFFMVAIPLALKDFGLWSIVYANFVQNCVATTLIWITANHFIPKKLSFNRNKFISLAAFGFFSMVESLLWNVMSRVFGLLIAMFHGATAVGLYNMATKLTDSVLNILNNSIVRITLPIFSSLQDDKNNLLFAFQASTYYFNLISMPIFIVMAMTANNWVPIFLGDKWSAVIPAVQVISIMYGVMYSRMFVGIVIKALGRSKDFLILSFTAAMVALGTIFFTYNMSLYITLTVLAILRILITIPLGMFLLKKLCGFSYISQLSPLIKPVLVGLLIMVILLLTKFFIFPNKIIELVIQISVVSISFLGVVSFLWFSKKLKYNH